MIWRLRTTSLVATVPLSRCASRRLGIFTAFGAMLIAIASTPASPLQFDSGWIVPADEGRSQNIDEPIRLNFADAAPTPNDAHSGEAQAPKLRTPHPRPWHIEIGARSAHPRLHGTKRVLAERLEAPLLLDWANVFDHPYTPIDRNTNWGFGSIYVGFGRQENDWLIWNVYGGGSWGEDKNFDRFLTLTLDVDFKYRSFYVGTNVEIYPWKVPPVAPDMTFGDCLQASRPYVLAGLETGYVSGSGEGTYRINYIPLYHDSVSVRDWVTSCQLGLGWNLPLSESFSLNVFGDYSFNFYRPDEYNGWNLQAGLRYRF